MNKNIKNIKSSYKAQSAPNLATNNSKFLTNCIQKNEKFIISTRQIQEDSCKNTIKMNGNTNNNKHYADCKHEENELKFSPKYFKSFKYKRIKHFSNYSTIWRLITKIVSFVLNFLTFFTFLLALAILLPIKLLKVSTFKILFYCNLINISPGTIDSPNDNQHEQISEQNNIEYMHESDHYPEFLSPMELFWLHDSKFNKSIGSYLVVLDGNINKSYIKELIRNRILMASSRDGQRLFPRFTQIVKRIWGFGYAWVYANQFNINNHIEELSEKVTSLESLQEEIVRLTSCDLDRRRPLWKVYYKQNFGVDKGTILLYVYHMCFSDGVSLIRIFFKTIVDNKLAIDLKPRFSYRNLSYKLLKQLVLGWQRMFYECFIRRKDVNALRVPNLTGKKSICWSEAFSFVDANRLKLVTRSTFNDLFLSVLSGILRTYIQKTFGVNNPGGMNFIMPVDLRSNVYPVKLGVKSTLSVINVPTNIEGCIPRLWHTKERVKEFKNSSDFLSIYLLIKILFYTLPCSIATTIAKNLYGLNTVLATTITASNQSLSTVTIANRNVKNMFYFHPSISNIALSCSIITYGDEVRLSLVSDTGIVLNPKFLADEFIRQV